jgi:hypothetical protein
MSTRHRGSKQKAVQKSNTCCGSSIALFIIAFIALGLLSISFLTIFHLKPLEYSGLRTPILNEASTLPTKFKTVPIFEKEIVLKTQTPLLETKVSNKIEKKAEIEATNIHYELPVHPYYDKTDKKRGFDVHFIHIPKCGGTSMTAILREVACKLDPLRNKDCCTNPGAYMHVCMCIQICMNV